MEHVGHADSLLYIIFIIFTGAAFLSTFALLTKQSMLVSHIFLGVILGPYSLKVVQNPEQIMQVGEVGIMFLLFLLGLHLQPANLVRMLKQVTILSVISSIIFMLAGFGISYAFGFSVAESLVVGAAMMFSSTIVGLKLLPTSILHHKHTGELMIGILLLQDILAILVLLVLHGAQDGFNIKDFSLVLVSLPALMAIAYLAEKFILRPLFNRFDYVQEYAFMLAVGWCLGLSQVAGIFNLSPEIGAFVAGVSLASSSISLFIAESLKPLRDFFLVLFFFSIGATFDLSYLPNVIIPAVVLSVVILIIKPFTYQKLLMFEKEDKKTSTEVGFRLGQASEFALLIIKSALGYGLISASTGYYVQATTIITFIISSYFIIFKYPTPFSTTDKLRQS